MARCPTDPKEDAIIRFNGELRASSDGDDVSRGERLLIAGLLGGGYVAAVLLSSGFQMSLIAAVLGVPIAALAYRGAGRQSGEPQDVAERKPPLQAAVGHGPDDATDRDPTFTSCQAPVSSSPSRPDWHVGHFVLD